MLILIAAIIGRDCLVCVEEPEAHLHPTLQRRLARVIEDLGTAQLVVATHSAALVDSWSDNVVSIHRDPDGRSVVNEVRLPGANRVLRSLGYRPSDLLQANTVIWVEGPSDRVYLLAWLGAADPELREGIDFSFCFYGGSLLGRLEAVAQDGTHDDLANIWRINPSMYLVADSDGRAPGQEKPRLSRLLAEVQSVDGAGVWVTSGYCIETYIAPDVLERAAKSVHRSVLKLQPPRDGRPHDPLTRLKTANENRFLQSPDKVAIAQAVVEATVDLDVSDLQHQVHQLVTFIRAHA